MVEAKDYLIAGIGGAATGFFDNQEKQNAEAKQQEQLKRQAELVMLKEERAAEWAMRKQKDKQSFEMDKLGVEQRNKSTEAEKKRAQELFDAGAKNEFEMDKLKAEHGFKSGEAKTKHGYDVELEGIKSGKAATEKTAKARTELRKEFENSKKKEFGEDSKQDFDSWASTTYPELYAEAYPDGATGTPAVKSGPSKFGSIFQKVTGAASKTKQGANDQPVTGALPAATTGNPADTLKSESLPPAPVQEPAPGMTRAEELQQQGREQRSTKLVSTVGVDDVSSAATELAKGFIAGTKKGAKVISDLYGAFLGKPTEDLIKWAVSSQNQQAATFVLGQRLKNGVITAEEYNAAVAELK